MYRHGYEKANKKEEEARKEDFSRKDTLLSYRNNAETCNEITNRKYETTKRKYETTN